MDAETLGRILNNLPTAVRSQQELLERFRLELSSYDEMRERGDGREVMAERTSRELPGNVAHFLSLMDSSGYIDDLTSKPTDKVAAMVLHTIMTSLAYSCVAIQVYTQRLVDAGQSLDEAIASAEDAGWMKLRDPDPS